MIPCSRHTSGTARPFFTCLTIAIIWLSENLDCFIAELSSSMVENSTFNPDYLLGGHRRPCMNEYCFIGQSKNQKFNQDVI